MKTTCVVATGVNEVAVRECEVREPQAGEVVVATEFSAISPGTELRCLAGKEPNAGAFPMITGYSLAGRVVGSGEPVWLNGARVCPTGITSAWGGHLSHVIAKADELVKLPASVDLKAASALAMLAIAFHGVCRAAPMPGDHVVVTGQGLIGLFATMFLRLAGCRVTACDPVPARRELARHLGATATSPTATGEADILVDASGSPAVVRDAVRVLRDKGWDNLYRPAPKLVLLASYPGDVALDYQGTLFNKETDVITCRNFLPHERDRVVRLLAERAIDPSAVLTDVVPVAHAPAAFRRLREDPARQVTVVLDWKSK